MADIRLIATNGTPTDLELKTAPVLGDAFKRAMNAVSSGVLTGAVMTVNGGDLAKLDISDGSGLVINSYTDPTNPTIVRVSWTGKTAIVLTNIATADSTYIAIDATAAVIQSTSPFNSAQRRQYIVLGVVHHPNHATIDEIGNAQVISFDVMAGWMDFVTQFGPFVENGMQITANGANLKINNSAGAVFKAGINYEVDPSRPNDHGVDAAAAIVFECLYQTAPGVWAETADTDVIDPENYDTGAGLGAVPVGNFTIQLVEYLPALSEWHVQYGQTVYATMAEAVANIPVPVPLQTLETPFVIRAYLVVKQGCVNLSNAAQARFVPAGPFGITQIAASGVGGEMNTGSNINTAGVGVFVQKLGVDLQFKGVKAGSTKVTVTDVPADNTIAVDVVVAQIAPLISHALLANVLPDQHHPRAHSLASTSDHNSTIVVGRMMMADANGLPAQASNTDAQVSAAVTASHARLHAMDSASDHGVGTGTPGQFVRQVAGAVAWSSHAEQTLQYNFGTASPSGQFLQANGSNANEDQSQYPIVVPSGTYTITLVVSPTTSTYSGGRTMTFTVRVNNANTAIVATATGTGTFTATGSIAVTQGQHISVACAQSAGGAGTMTRGCASLRLSQ